jgi:formate dehydrogenase subunit gamma
MTLFTPAAASRQRRVVRFTGSERAIHWIVAIAFLSLLGSGLLMGQRGSVHNLMYTWHLTSAGILALGVAVVILRGNRRALARTARQLGTIDPLDRAWLRSVPGAVLRHRAHPPAGRFNAGQKVNFILISLLLAALVISGIGLLIAGSPPNPIFKAAHVAAAYLSIVLILGHLYMALINPSTRPALSGMITGKLDQAWLEKEHPRATSDDDASAGGPDST